MLFNFENLPLFPVLSSSLPSPTFHSNYNLFTSLPLFIPLTNLAPPPSGTIVKLAPTFRSTPTFLYMKGFGSFRTPEHIHYYSVCGNQTVIYRSIAKPTLSSSHRFAIIKNRWLRQCSMFNLLKMFL